MHIEIFGKVIWGAKTVAWFDIWSFEYFLSGISIGFLIMGINSTILKKAGILNEINTKHLDIIGVLFIAYFWETIEHYLEIGVAGDAVAHWFYGVEAFPNRVITDPLLMVLGYLLTKKYDKIVYPARFLSVMSIQHDFCQLSRIFEKMYTSTATTGPTTRRIEILI